MKMMMCALCVILLSATVKAATAGQCVGESCQIEPGTADAQGLFQTRSDAKVVVAETNPGGPPPGGTPDCNANGGTPGVPDCNTCSLERDVQFCLNPPPNSGDCSVPTWGANEPPLPSGGNWFDTDDSMASEGFVGEGGGMEETTYYALRVGMAALKKCHAWINANPNDYNADGIFTPFYVLPDPPQDMEGPPTPCFGWNNGMDSETTRRVKAVLESAASPYAAFANAFAYDPGGDFLELQANSSLKDSGLLDTTAKGLAAAATNRSTSDPCVNPKVDPPAGWACQCYPNLIGACPDESESCFKAKFCANAQVDQAWKTEQGCPPGSVAGCTKALLLQQSAASRADKEKDDHAEASLDESLTLKKTC